MVRGEMGLKNVEIMIPFVRTLDMAKDVNEVLEAWLHQGIKWCLALGKWRFWTPTNFWRFGWKMIFLFKLRDV